MHASLLALTLALSLPAAAQMYRPGDPDVIKPPPREAPPAVDPAATFRSAYAAARSPRIFLFWNTLLTEATAENRIARETDTVTASRSMSRLKKTTQGDSQSAELTDGDGKSEVRRVKEKQSVVVDDTRLQTTLSPRNATVLERTFGAEMRRGGVSFVDRALAIRTTAAEKHRGGGDSRLMETDALVGKAELLMQVVMIPDASAPLGWAFDVTVRDIAAGQEVASIYTPAMPAGLVAPARWVATDRGFQKRQERREPTVEDIAVALAHEVMQSLGASLAQGAPRSRR